MTGAVLRFLTGVWLTRLGAGLVWPTFTVNILGSFLFGATLAYINKNDIDQHYKLLLLTGFCGGFTTFSALSYEGFVLFREQQFQQLLLYFLASAVLGVLAIAGGYQVFQNTGQ